MSATAEPVVCELISLLSLERLEDNLFRGQSRDIGTKYVFGGQVLGQALSAAQATVENGRQAHSLHAHFLRVGNIDHPIVYDVDRTRDGGSFSVRRVTAIQHGKVIFFCAASFQEHEDGAEHQSAMPVVPPPEDIEPAAPLTPEVLAKLPAKVQRWLSRGGPFEFRHVFPRDELKPPKRPPFQQMWLRLNNPIGDDVGLHRALLAYARISSCWALRHFRTASAITRRTCRWPRSITHCGSIARSAPTTGCCIRSTAPPRKARAAWRAGSFSPATACWWPAPRRKV